MTAIYSTSPDSVYNDQVNTISLYGSFNYSNDVYYARYDTQDWQIAGSNTISTSLINVTLPPIYGYEGWVYIWVANPNDSNDYAYTSVYFSTPYVPPVYNPMSIVSTYPSDALNFQWTSITVYGSNFPLALSQSGRIRSCTINGQNATISPSNSDTSFQVNLPGSISGSTVNLSITYQVYEDDYFNTNTFTRSFSYQGDNYPRNPTITSISPNSGVWGQGKEYIAVISGSGFAQDATVWANGILLPAAKYNRQGENTIIVYIAVTDFVANDPGYNNSSIINLYVYNPQTGEASSGNVFDTTHLFKVTSPQIEPIGTDIKINSIANTSDNKAKVYEDTANIQTIVFTGNNFPQPDPDGRNVIRVYLTTDLSSQVAKADIAITSDPNSYNGFCYFENSTKLVWKYDLTNGQNFNHFPFGKSPRFTFYGVKVYDGVNDAFSNSLQIEYVNIADPTFLSITDVNPSQVSPGQTVRISGTGFVSGMAVTLYETPELLASGNNGLSCKNVTVTDSSNLTCVLPTNLKVGSFYWVQLSLIRNGNTVKGDWSINDPAHGNLGRILCIDPNAPFGPARITGVSLAVADDRGGQFIEISGYNFDVGGYIYFGPRQNQNDAQYRLRDKYGTPITLTKDVSLFGNNLIKGYVPPYPNANNILSGNGVRLNYVPLGGETLDPISSQFTFYYFSHFSFSNVQAYLDRTVGDIGDRVTLYGVQGTGFDGNNISKATLPSGAEVLNILVGGNYAVNAIVNADTSVSFNIPPGDGLQELYILLEGGGGSPVSGPNGNPITFTYNDTYTEPYITTISPNAAAVGNEVTIFGGNFDTLIDDIRIFFGDVEVLKQKDQDGNYVNFVSTPQPDAITVKVPQQIDVTKKFVDVIYAGPNSNRVGLYVKSSPQQFFYLEGSRLAIFSLSVTQGPPSGGTKTVVQGQNFSPQTQVLFDGKPATTRFISPAAIEATTPAANAGKSIVDVSVTETNSNPATLYGGFTYITVPVDGGGGGLSNTSDPDIQTDRVTPLNVLGGDGSDPIRFINVKGNKFGDQTSRPMVFFDGKLPNYPMPQINLDNGTKVLTVQRYPAHNPGVIDVTITFPQEPDRPNIYLKNIFTYAEKVDDSPQITSIDPSDGTSVGGNESITIHGKNFSKHSSTASVIFSDTQFGSGQNAYPGSVQVVSDDTIICSTPVDNSVGSIYVTVLFGDGTRTNPFSYTFLPIPSNGTQFRLEVANADTNLDGDWIYIESISEFTLERKIGATPARLIVRVPINYINSNTLNKFKFDPFQRIRLLHQDPDVVRRYTAAGSNGVTVFDIVDHANPPDNYTPPTVSMTEARQRLQEKWFSGFIQSAELKQGPSGRYWEITALDNLVVLQNNNVAFAGKWRSAYKSAGARGGADFLNQVNPDSIYNPDYTRPVERTKFNSGPPKFLGGAAGIYPKVNNKYVGEYRKYIIQDLALNIVPPDKKGLTDVVFPDISNPVQKYFLPNSKPITKDFNQEKRLTILDAIRGLMYTDPFLHDSGYSPDEVNSDDIQRSTSRSRSGVGGEFQMKYSWKYDREGVAEYFQRGTRWSGLALYHGVPLQGSEFLLLHAPKTHEIIEHNLQYDANDLYTRVIVLSKGGDLVGSYNINTNAESNWSRGQLTIGTTKSLIVQLNTDIPREWIASDQRDPVHLNGSESNFINDLVKPLIDSIQTGYLGVRVPSITVAGDPRYKSDPSNGNVDPNAYLPDFQFRLPMPGENIFVNIPSMDNFYEWFTISGWKYSYPENKTVFALGRPAKSSYEEAKAELERSLSEIFNRESVQDTGWIPGSEFKNKRVFIRNMTPDQYHIIVEAAEADPQKTAVTASIPSDDELKNTAIYKANSINQEVVQKYPYLAGSVEPAVDPRLAWAGIKTMYNGIRSWFRTGNTSGTLPSSMSTSTGNNVNPYNSKPVKDRSGNITFEGDLSGAVPVQNTTIRVSEYSNVDIGNSTNGLGYMTVSSSIDETVPDYSFALLFPTGNVAIGRNGQILKLDDGKTIIRAILIKK